jgi:hypothetical protein
MIHVYFGIENLALDDTQRATLIDALRALGPSNHPSPAFLCHWRTRPDGKAAIFEALFDEDTITIDAFKNRLGAISSIDPATIDHAINRATFAVTETAIVTFSRGGSDYLRVAFCGYDGSTWPSWEQPRAECLAYLALYAAQWTPGG